VPDDSISLSKINHGANVVRTRAADDFATIRTRLEELRHATRPRAADDVTMIRARMEELRRERASINRSGAPFGDRPETVSSCRE
jgi:hypothetical protein